ncbi:MAG: hypothetical protein KJ561_03650, partial [Nanoarchaeota archaeon]|nr:hypothetical protein [Nanoarchaeota archaeon]
MGLIQPFEFPVGPRTGSELRRIYDAFVPFNKDGKLKSDELLITLLASKSRTTSHRSLIAIDWWYERINVLNHRIRLTYTVLLGLLQS